MSILPEPPDFTEAYEALETAIENDPVETDGSWGRKVIDEAFALGRVVFRHNDDVEFASLWERAAHLVGNYPELEDALIRGYRDFDRSVEEAEFRQRVNETAQARREAARAAAVASPFEVIKGEDFLAREPDSSTPFRVDQFLVSGGYTLIVAYQKTGKTTLVANLVKSLATGEPFLGVLPVVQVQGRVTLLNMELTADLQWQWLTDHGAPGGKLNVVNLNGRAGAVNVLDDAVRAKLAQDLRDADTEVLIVDPIGPILRKLGLNEDKDVGRLIDAFKELCAEAGVSELVILHHTGHVMKDRPRGDSTFGDTPDVIASLTKGPKGGVRTLSVEGRDAEYKSTLKFDRETRTLTGMPYTAEQWQARGPKGADAQAPILDLLREVDGALSTSDIAERLEKGTDATRKALERAVRRGDVKRVGQGQWRLADAA